MNESEHDGQFSEMGMAYEESQELPLRRELEAPSMLAALGDVAGLKVLDVGCGSGFYTRLLARAGAANVTGLDESAGMLAVAAAREEAEGLGVSYHHGDMAEAAKLGPFDLVCGVYVLPYAQSFERLAAMCRGAAGALRPGGRFVTFALNPDTSVERAWYEPYGFTIEPAEADASRREGMPITLALTFTGTSMALTAYVWSRESHERALAEAGLCDVTWTAPRPTPEGVAEKGAAYWDRYIACPHALIIQARRP